MDLAGEQEPRPGGLEIPSAPTGFIPGADPSTLVISGLGRNTLWRYVNLLASSLAGIFIVALALRRLGTAAYGLFALAVAIIGLLNTVDFGLQLAVIRATARDTDVFSSDERVQARSDVETAHFAYGSAGTGAALLSAVTGLVVYVTVGGLSAAEHFPAAIALIGLSVGLSLGTSAYGGILIGRRQFQVPSVGGVLGTIAELVLVVLLIDHLRLVALGLGLLAYVVVSQGYIAWWLRHHETWFRLIPRPHQWVTVRRVAAFAAPLIVIPLAGQVIPATDLAVVGAVATAGAVGLYQAGSVIPGGVISFLFTGFDTVYPHLAGTLDSSGQEVAVRFLTRVAAFIGGAAFATVILLPRRRRTGHARPAVGTRPIGADRLLRDLDGQYPAPRTWAAAHRRGRQRVFVPLIAAETIANLALTGPFAIWMGPIGAAVATLVTIAISNLILFPYITRREFLGGPVWGPTAAAIASMVVGGASAGIVVAPLLLVSPGLGRLIGGLFAGGVVSCALGLLLLRREGRSTLAAMLRRPAE